MKSYQLGEECLRSEARRRLQIGQGRRETKKKVSRLASGERNPPTLYANSADHHIV